MQPSTRKIIWITLCSPKPIELNAIQELLEFTQGLDFGKYIRDAEVQSMIDQVKKRITEIESRPEVDEEIDEDVEGGGQSNNSEDEVEARLEVNC